MSEDYYKEVIELYKVYLYTNRVNDKKYCGVTKKSLRRRSEGNGYGYIRSVSKSTPKFAQAIIDYGWDNFKLEILYEVETKEEAYELEIKTIKELRLTEDEFGYNMHFGGTKVNPLHCSRPGKQNGMYGKGYKLEGAKNGKARKIKVIFNNGDTIIFDTQKEAGEYLGISKQILYRIRNTEGKYYYPKGTKQSTLEKYKHLQGIEIINL